MGFCTKLDHALPLRTRQFLAIVFGIVEMFFFGGIIFGFNALTPVMQTEGIYGHLCNGTNSSTSGCSEQTAMYGYAFTTYMVVQMVMLFIVGFLVDHVGLRIVKFGSSLLFSIGSVLFAVINTTNSWLIFPAGSFICVGGMAGLICNFAFSKLFTKSSVFVLALITGSYDASSSVFAFITLAYNAGFSYQLTFILIAAIGLAMNTFSSLFIATYKLSDMSMFHSNEEKNLTMTNTGDDEEKNSSLAKSESSEDEIANIIRGCYPTALSSLRSFPFFMITCFFSFAMLRFTFFLAQFGFLTEYHFPTEPSIRAHLAQVISFALAGGVIAGMACGATVDFLRARFNPMLNKSLSVGANKAVFWLRLCPHAIAMLVVTFAATVLSCLVFLPFVQVYYVNYCFLVIMRGFLFSTISSFIMTAFPIEQFGTLYGISGTLAGAFSCIQYALLMADVRIANIVCFAFVLLMAFIPITVLSLSSRMWKRRQ
nr:solute carrier family 43 [Hymenolepis microstoma]